MKKPFLFDDVKTVSTSARVLLRKKKLVFRDIPVPWMQLSPRMPSLTSRQAKMLILLELERKEGSPREDILHRLVVKVTKIGQQELETKIANYLK